MLFFYSRGDDLWAASSKYTSLFGAYCLFFFLVWRCGQHLYFHQIHMMYQLFPVCKITFECEVNEYKQAY